MSEKLISEAVAAQRRLESMCKELSPELVTRAFMVAATRPAAAGSGSITMLSEGVDLMMAVAAVRHHAKAGSWGGAEQRAVARAMVNILRDVSDQFEELVRE